MNSENLTGWTEKLKGMFSKEKRTSLIFILGIAGMVLVLLSQFLPKAAQEKAEAEQTMTTEQYIMMTEERLCGMVQSIEGVGSAKVMVTLEQGTEYIYATQQKSNTDLSQSFNGDESKSVQKRDNSEESYLLVDGAGGKRTAVLQTEILPKVKGVVVLCEGAGNRVVEQRVTEAVRIALDLSASKVYVTKLS